MFIQFKEFFIELKSYLIQRILKAICIPLIKLGYHINLSLQECDYYLFEQIKKRFSNIFNGIIYSPQNTLTYQINDFIDFSINPSENKIIQSKSDTNTSHGFITLSTLEKTLSIVKVFNSLVLNHEKKSKIRGLTFTTRGIYIPELELYNLHLKSTNAYKNLVSLEKYHIDKDISEYNSIYGLNYDFTNKTYTQLFATNALVTILPHINLDYIHHIIDVIYERKYSFDQIIFELSKTTQTFNSSSPYINILEGLEELEEHDIFLNINFDTFIKAINIHYAKRLEKWICNTILKKAIKQIELLQICTSNPDIIIKEFCSKLNLGMSCNLLNNFVNNKNLTICGDINMILEDSNESRIKKYSFKSKSNEDEPFNHLLTMKMNSSGNDVIFYL